MKIRKEHKLWSRWKDLIRSILIPMIILSSFEISLGILDVNNQLGEPYQWGNRNDIAFKINEAKALFSQYPPNILKILVIGDSCAVYDVDPRGVDNYFNHTTITYDLGIYATSNRLQIFLLLNAILPKIRPDFIIWSIHPMDFDNMSWRYAQDEELLTTPMARIYSDNTAGLDLPGLLDFYLIKFSKVYRYRFEAIRAGYEGSLDRGYNRTYLSWYKSNDTDMVDLNYTNPFDTQSGQDFLSILDYLEASKIRYLIMAPPQNHRHWINLGVENVFSQIRPEYFLNLNGNSTLAPDDLYFTESHLNAYGAAISTRYVCEKITCQINDILTTKS